MGGQAPTKTVTLKDGSGLTLYWSAALRRFVTVPEA